jgi:hypothetical protein
MPAMGRNVLRAGRPIACLLLLLTAGCAYARHRARDAADIFTATVGMGLGFGVQAAPIDTGLGLMWDAFGVRDGCAGANHPGHFSSGWDFFYPIGMKNSWYAPYARARAKYYEARCYGILFPEYKPGLKGTPALPPCYTQLEVWVGLFGSLRLGVNPGELADFLLGFFGLDMYHDDVEGAGRSPDEGEDDEDGRK